MELTKELLEKRIEVLEAQKAQTMATANACEGGILILRGLLSELDREEDNDEGAGDESAPSEENTDAVDEEGN